MTKPHGPEVKTEVITITREIATAFLEKNREHAAGIRGTNRKVSPTEMAKWSADMLADRWRLTHEGWAFDNEGYFIDGQHRAKAFLAAEAKRPGLTIQTLVTYGLEPEVFKVINIGRRRRMSDVLSTEGYTNVYMLHTVARMHFCYNRVPYQAIHTWTSTVLEWNNDVMLGWVDKYPSIAEGVEYVSSLAKFRNVGILSSMACGYALARQIRPDIDIIPFMERLAHGKGASDFEPAYELRERLIKRTRGVRATPVERVEQLALFCKAFNAYADGRLLKNLSWDSGGPGSFPLIKAPQQEGLV